MFLEAFTADHQALFLDAGESVALPRGSYLMRRGDPGGDIYLLKTGALEVVDRRATPEIVLAAVSEGTIVGEIAFVDESPRSADVRAARDSEVIRWARDDLRNLLNRHADFAASFFETLSRVATQRIRHLTDGAVARVSGADAGADEEEAVRGRVAEVAEPLKRELPELDAILKRDPEEPLAVGRVIGLMEELQGEVHALFEELDDVAHGRFASELLGREIHPWLSRSFLAERCFGRPRGSSSSAEILAHLLLDRAGGDGPLGEHLDRWLLDRPTFRALRSLRLPLVDAVVRTLPLHRNRRVVVVNAGTGSLVARLSDAAMAFPTIITVVDQSRDALSFLDAGMVQRRQGVALETVRENLASLAIGRARPELGPADAVVLHGLLEYMPERIAVSMLREARGWLAEDGQLLVASLLPSEDHHLVDRLLGWPTIRRTRQETEDLFLAADLVPQEVELLDDPVVLVAASIEEATVLRKDMETEIRPRGDVPTV